MVVDKAEGQVGSMMYRQVAKALDLAVRLHAALRRLAGPGGAAAQRGFSLMEMLVVLVIIGLLAGLVGPRLLSNVDRGKSTTADAQAKMLKGALETLRLDIGRFPTEEEGLDLLIAAPRDPQLAARWMGPYLDGTAVPADPWGRPYGYRPNGNQSVFVYSLGADGRPGGTGADADVGYVPANI